MRSDSFASFDDAGTESLDRLERNVAHVETLLAGAAHRLVQRNPITDMPTREPFFARIEQDIAGGMERGLLGVIAFTDFERLTAFDPDLAEHGLTTLADRITRMLGARYGIAQIDRSRFAIWYPDDCDPDQSGDGLWALGYALGGVIPHHEREIVPEIMVGAARYPKDGATPSALLSAAIATLSATRMSANDSDRLAGDPVAGAQERYVLEQDLRRAVARAEFELHFQPLVDAAAGTVCGAEALLRWYHPVQGLISPTRFVPIMEAAGLADEVGLWTLNAACREARGWQRQRLGSLRVAVNVSGHQLARTDMRALVERTLARHSLRPQALELELTETVATADAGKAAKLFEDLRALGIAIAIDDFGTGYSSLSVLRTLSFDKIKIDREFVTEVDRRGDSQAICESIIALGSGLGIRVLAEGVERYEEYAWLRAAGCTHFQGYYFSRPLQASDFIDFVRDVPHLRALLALPSAGADRDFSERLSA